MKIAVFSNRFPVLSQTFVMNQVIELLSEHDVEVLCFKKDESNAVHAAITKYDLMSKVRSLGISGHLSGADKLSFLIKFLFYSVSSPSNFKKIRKILTSNHIDKDHKQVLINLCLHQKRSLEYDDILVHFGNWGYIVCLMRELGLIKGSISVIFHGFEVSRYKVVEENLQAYKDVFESADRILPISQFWQDKLIKFGCPADKVFVKRMGVNTENFLLRDVTQPFGSSVKLLQVGRLTEKKAILDSIRAVSEARKQTDIEFSIIGDGDEYEQAKKLIDELEASDYIHLLGSQSSDEVRRELARSDIFLLPSVTACDGDMEGIPVSLMEAMATGAVVISTRHSGIPELIEHGKSGFLVEEHDIQALSQAIVDTAALQAEEIEDLRMNAWRKIQQDFDNTRLAKTLFLEN